MDTPQVEAALLADAAEPLHRGAVDAVLGPRAPTAAGGRWACATREPPRRSPTSRHRARTAEPDLAGAPERRAAGEPCYRSSPTSTQPPTRQRRPASPPGLGSQALSPVCRPCRAGAAEGRSGCARADPRRRPRPGVRSRPGRSPGPARTRRWCRGRPGGSRWRRTARGEDRWLLESLPRPDDRPRWGPGRLVTALAARGVPALGVDVSVVAQRQCRRRRAPMLRRDLFRPLPGEGTWQHVLLADGNSASAATRNGCCSVPPGCYAPAGPFSSRPIRHRTCCGRARPGRQRCAAAMGMRGRRCFGHLAATLGMHAIDGYRGRRSFVQFAASAPRSAVVSAVGCAR